jgi:hypothetical protein
MQANDDLRLLLADAPPPDLADLPAVIDGLPPRARLAVARLIALLLLYVESAPEELLREVDAISLYGLEPHDQLERLEELLERWSPKH